MKRFIIFLFVVAFGCESDCVSCHPKLKKLYNPNNKYYNEHSFLKECTKCHKSHPVKNKDKCGVDCFECHNRKKLINTPTPQHQRLKSCIKCHMPSLNDLLP